MCFFLAIFFFRFSFRHNFCVAFLVSKSFIMSLAFDEYGRPFLIVKVPTPLASRRLPLLQPPSSSSSPLSFSRRLLFFSTPKRFKSRLSFDRKTKAHTLDVSFISLSLSLHIRNKAPSRDFEASRRKRQTSPPRRAWRER